MTTEAFVIKCPHCGSTELRSEDKVHVTCDVDSWTVVDGKLEPEYNSAGSEVYWDSQHPNDENEPWGCGDCLCTFSAAELLAAECVLDDGDRV